MRRRGKARTGARSEAPSRLTGIGSNRIAFSKWGAHGCAERSPDLDGRLDPGVVLDRPGLQEGNVRHRLDRAEYGATPIG